MPGGPGGPIPPGGHIPFTDDVIRLQKAKMKEGGVKETNDSSDVFTPSDAAKLLPSTDDEKFLARVKPDISSLDPDSETFLEEATEKLVGNVLGQEYGEHIERNPAFPQMQEKITRTILENPEYREQVADLIEMVLMTAPVEEGPPPEEVET